jgi:AcrR family transcriptional regulator
MSTLMTSRRDENAEATRAALLAAARRAFADAGYSGADVGAIAAEARVTTGAIYHHFGSKKGLFQAVAEAIETEILTKAETGAGELSWSFLTTAFARLIDLCAAPDIQRIIFAEGSQVLGPDAWRELEGRYAIGAVTGVLTHLMAEGVVRQAPIELVARLMVAILREASAEVARTGGDPAARAEVARLTHGFLETLLAR